MKEHAEQVSGQPALFIGIDWADQKHDVSLLDLEVPDPASVHSVIEATPKALMAWARSLIDIRISSFICSVETPGRLGPSALRPVTFSNVASLKITQFCATSISAAPEC